MKILLTGASGQVGNEILKSKPKDAFIINPNRYQLDLSDYSSCKNMVLKNKPDWIINCGAYTSVDGAEKDIELSSSCGSLNLDLSSSSHAIFDPMTNKSF